MSLQILKEIVFVAMGDETFRQKLAFNPDEILSKYELTKEELLALRLGSSDRMKALGLDPALAEYGASLFSKRR
jgi:hypothetical protein